MQIISRPEWGARHPDGAGDTPMPAREVWLHHSAGVLPDMTPPYDDDYAAVRAIEAEGQRRFKRGVPYTFVITPVGLIFQGLSVHRLGAHTYGHNTVGRAICWTGNYELHGPTEQLIEATAWLLRHGRDRGWWVTPALTGGHRDVSATVCPGRHAYAAIPEINRRARGKEHDMQPDERDALYDIREQLTGSRSSRPPAYPGWPTDDGDLTVVDMLRSMITRQRAIEDTLSELLKEPPG